MNRTHLLKHTLATSALMLAMLLGHTAWAQDPVEDLDNECTDQGGQGLPCDTSTDCALNAYATLCIEHLRGDPTSRRCEIPCEEGEGIDFERQAGLCAKGETCIEGKASPGRPAHFCQPTRFRMDLNLLDACVQYWLQGTQPGSLGSENVCSLEANLNRLLDQNGDNEFDIFDLDMCVLSFLEQPTCDPQEASCEADDLVLCDDDDDCGTGLYCDTNRNACTRDCGFIASRELATDVLDRQCSGFLKTCDYERGRCEEVELDNLTCEIDRDCPPGAYCLLGQCAPQCSRSVDCPDSRWYCTENNRCRALPSPQADDGFVFDPQSYVIRFARAELSLDAVENSDFSPLAIMDLRTRRQVVNNPSISFGYRLETSYDRKQDEACLKPFVDCSDEVERDGEAEDVCFARQADCLIDDTEEWIRLLSPFGVVTAVGNPGLTIELNEEAADRLSPGLYTATIRAIYDNGDSHSIRVTYNKPTLSGEYEGTLTVTLGGQNNVLNGERPINFGMKIRVFEDEVIRWNELMEANNLAQEEDFTDITQGFLVRAQLHGNTSYAFTKGGERTYLDNEVPFIGLYSPQLQRMRLLGFIDVTNDFCIGVNEGCQNGEDLHARNLFGRDIRRQIEFIGPYDEAGRRFHGIYREKISGLTSYDVTVDGGFIMDQSTPDESGLEQADALMAPGTPAVQFPGDEDRAELLEDRIEALCEGVDPEVVEHFSSKANFEAYLEQATRRRDANNDTAIFPTQVQFTSAIENALGLLQDGLEFDDRDRAALSLHDFLAGRILPCDDERANPGGCIDEQETRCGLALYQKALLQKGINAQDSWVNRDAVLTDELAGRLPLRCSQTLQPDGCEQTGSDKPEVFAHQEHNTFWFNLIEQLKFDGDHAQSDAFLTLYRNQINPFQIGAALNYKRERLLTAIRRYDEATEVMMDTYPTAVLFDWPVGAYIQGGYEWFGPMQSVLSDRLSAVAEFADLTRRAFGTNGEDDFLVAQHIMQHEYLYQVYLATLQLHWQGPENFVYEGRASTVFEQGQLMLGQYDPARNPIGVVDGQVYLENDDPSRSNWQYYRDLLVAEGGMIPSAREEIDEAVANLQGSLSDLDDLESALFEAHQGMQRSIEELCGPADDFENQCTRANEAFVQNTQAWINQFECTYGTANGERPAGCTKEPFECADYNPGGSVEIFRFRENTNGRDNCKKVISRVRGTQSARGLDGNLPFNFDVDQCVFNNGENGQPQFMVQLKNERRACVGGSAGELLQARAEQMRNIEGINGRIDNFLQVLNGKLKAAEGLRIDDRNRRIFDRAYELTRTVYNNVKAFKKIFNELFTTLADLPDCIFVVGFSNGTDCPQKAIATNNKAVLKFQAGIEAQIFQTIRDSIDRLIKLQREESNILRGIAAKEREFRSIERELNPLVQEYRLAVEAIYHIDLQLQDIEFQASAIEEDFAEQSQFLMDRLVGRESGSTLFGRQLVLSSTASFRQAHQYTYRMLQAFIHEYNLSKPDATVLTNRLLAAITLDDLEEIIDELERRDREYCGQEAIDCDAFANTEVLRFSLRDNLFPYLTDVIDPGTGRVVTAGEQFHNIITSPPWFRRRLFGNYTVDQIELPFSIPLNDLTGPDGEGFWVINPLTCGQFLSARSGIDINHPGNVAVNIKGRNLGEGENAIRYELVRGDTDFVRACSPESVIVEEGQLPEIQFPIRRHIVGYAPQSEEARQQTPPTYVTRSGPLSSCINQPERNGDLSQNPGCWRYFARGRSLASLDWRLSIPISINNAATENTWVAGEGLSDEERPIIDDIVLYFRYSSRPIGE